MEQKRDFELYIDRGFGEKKVLISEEPIDLNPENNTSLYRIHQPDLIVFGCSGTQAPFHKGSAVLRSIRTTAKLPVENWKLILQINDDPDKTFSILDIKNQESDPLDKYYGIWLHKSEDRSLYPDLILLNYPIQLIRYKLKKEGLPEEKIPELFPEILSRLYRSLLAAIDAYLMFSLGTVKIKTILMSDIGAMMLKDTQSVSNQSLRITIFSQVLGSWIGIHPDMEKIIIAYAEGQSTGRLEKQVSLWAEQEKNSLGEEADMTNAAGLRIENQRFCIQIHELLPGQSNFESLRVCLKTSADIFGSGNAILATDALQARKLTEALTRELTEIYKTKSTDSTLDSYIRRLEETKRISPWMTSYMHLIRVLGNEAAHYNKEQQKRPERPAGKDLTVIHAALGRILSFCLQEFKNR